MHTPDDHAIDRLSCELVRGYLESLKALQRTHPDMPLSGTHMRIVADIYRGAQLLEMRRRFLAERVEQIEAAS